MTAADGIHLPLQLRSIQSAPVGARPLTRQAPAFGARMAITHGNPEGIPPTRCGMRIGWMRSGISFEVTGDDRQRLLAVIADRNSP